MRSKFLKFSSIAGENENLKQAFIHQEVFKKN